ncbi:hypothetical protein [Vineibacter terrae]|uniref:hypothetical protein n=1 Tax=Vineibacter terrae TaxID=2586908 RepID=UPI002E381D0D|nr:hypothetical protein [Vineibacter terrae]HEX2888719.1 hypothetical protein [Vineibacter terrae]
MGGMMAGFGALAFVIYLIGVAIVTVPFWFILKRAGFSPYLALLNLILGLGTLIVMAILAFSKWPAGESGRTSTVQDLMRQVQGGR